MGSKGTLINEDILRGKFSHSISNYAVSLEVMERKFLEEMSKKCLESMPRVYTWVVVVVVTQDINQASVLGNINIERC